MNKMVINHLEKLFVTRDASTIINELEVEHPAARLLVFAAQAQQQEIGDGTNFVRFLSLIWSSKQPYLCTDSLALPVNRRGVISLILKYTVQVVSFAGDLLSSAEGLLRDGLHTSEVAEGYTKAATKVCLLTSQPFPTGCSLCNAHTSQTEPLTLVQALEIMEKLILPGSDKMDVRDPKAVAKRIKGSVCSKQYGYEDLLSPLIAKVICFPSCHAICQEESTRKQSC